MTGSLVVLHVTLLHVCASVVFRTGFSARVLTKVSASNFGCGRKSTCTGCLTFKKFGRHSCQWCPREYWNGEHTAFKGLNASGVCRNSLETTPLQCGGGWYALPATVLRGSVQTAMRTCPKPEELQVWRKNRLRSLTVTDLKNPAVLGTVLRLINLDIERLNQLRTTNPRAFEGLFANTYGKIILANAWKLSAWGVGFVDTVGNVLSLGLGIATSAAEYVTGSISDLVSAQHTSQMKLCSEGKQAELQYFGDVTYGMLQKQYLELKRMQATGDHPMGPMGDYVLGGRAGEHAVNYDEAVNSLAARVFKAVLHTSLFAGGFVTGGLTWAWSTSIGAGELVSEWCVSFAAAKTLEHKTLLLVALARLIDKSAWENNNDRCDVSDWYRNVNPCPPVDDRHGFVNDRVCARSSPWGHHERILPRGSFSSEGRCVPRVRVPLREGLPCLTNEACQSGYCHFEPRLLYFFSDHPRTFCDEGEECTTAQMQLSSLQASKAEFSSESNMSQMSHSSNTKAIHGFTQSYQLTPKASLYATTGTCAIACPKHAIGRLSCREIFTGSKQGETSEYDFGLRKHGHIYVDRGQPGYVLIGRGACAKEAIAEEGNELTSLRTLQPSKNVKSGYDDEDLIEHCARACNAVTEACSSFTVDWSSRECFLHLESATNTQMPSRVDVESPSGLACYRRSLSWPMDIHQPWNIEWHSYTMNLNFVVDEVMASSSSLRSKKALKAIAKAYHDFCGGGGWFGVGSKSRCKKPSTWSYDVAVDMLKYTAPLGAEQLRLLRESLAPGTTEVPAKRGEKISILKMVQRPFGFGAAWRVFFGEDELAHMELAQQVSQRRVSAGGFKYFKPWFGGQTAAGDDETRGSFEKVWVQRMEALAAQLKLRTSDGTWDLRAAAKELEHFEGQQAAVEDPQPVRQPSSARHLSSTHKS